MTALLLVDDAQGWTELLADVIRTRLGWTVTVAHGPDVVADTALDGAAFDIAVIDLSFPGDTGRRSGIDVLLWLHRTRPHTLLTVLTQGDEWVADALRDAWEAFALASVLSKSAPIDLTIAALAAIARDGSSAPDPVLAPLLPTQRSAWRSVEGYQRLVPHAGHAKLWQALIDCDDEPSYRDLAEITGLKLNTIKNYRGQLLPELALHDLEDPTMREMQQFARRCRPFLEAPIAARLGGIPA